LALPLDEEELLETMGTSMAKTSSDLVDFVPSTVMEPLGTIGDWLFSFINLDLELTDEESSKSESLPLTEDTDGTILVKRPYINHPLFPGLLHTSNHLTVMMSEEDREVLHDNEEHNSDDEAVSVEEEEDTKSFSQGENRSKFRIEMGRRTHCTQDDEKKGLDIATPSMTDTSAMTKSSPDVEFIPSTPHLLTSPKRSIGAYCCPKCTYSCRRICDLR
jgi:hypothetical protein